MVDVSDKAPTHRTAVVQGRVRMSRNTFDLIKTHRVKKGNVLETARIAGIMAAKRTSELIPMCHPLPVEGCEISIDVDGQSNVVIDCTVRVHHRTGVEMEALVGAGVAALTVYDMCKSVSHDIRIGEIRLLRKTGGKRDFDVSSI